MVYGVRKGASWKTSSAQLNMPFNMNTRRHLPSIETSGKYLQPIDASGDGRCRTCLARSTGTSELSKERRLWRKVEQTMRMPSKFSLAKFTTSSCVIHSWSPLIQTRLFRIPDISNSKLFKLPFSHFLSAMSNYFAFLLRVRIAGFNFFPHFGCSVYSQ